RGGGPDAITVESAASETTPTLSYYPDGLVVLYARILVEPLNGARPSPLGRHFVVAFRRGVIEEAMHGVRIEVAFVADVVFLQFRFLRGLSLRQRLIERAVVDKNGRLDFGHVFRPGRA